MFEYDSQIALDDGEIVNGKLIVTFPHSAVVYLRHNARTPDALTVEINTPGGSISYRVPVMKTQTYTIKDIFDRNLLFLIPFISSAMKAGLRSMKQMKKSCGSCAQNTRVS